MVVDPGLSADETNDKFLRRAEETKALIQSTVHPKSFGGALLHHVYSNRTVFLDFFSDAGITLWNQGLTELYDTVPYDGLWLDMNEVTGFCNGECPFHRGAGHSVADKFTSLVAKEKVEDNSTWYTSYVN